MGKKNSYGEQVGMVHANVLVMSASTDSGRAYASDILRARLPQPARKLARRAAALAERAQQKAFDAFFGVSTSGTDITTADSLFVTGGDSTAYGGCQWLSVRSALSKLSPSDRETFVDIGAGKGKAVLIAARLGYRRALGVELDAGLAAQGQQNIELARPRLKAAQTEVLNVDALTWSIPDDVSVIFMLCPFLGDTFHRVAGAIIDAYDSAPRPLHIVYAKPWEHNWLLSTGRVAVIGVQPRFWPTQPGWWRSQNVTVTYRVMAKDASAADAKRLHGWRYRNQRAFERWSEPNGQVFDFKP
jgi:SAM-dependent methyltransferase